MATLWALTGTLDPRPMMDAKVADVVNDECKVSDFPFLYGLLRRPSAHSLYPPLPFVFSPLEYAYVVR